jgi:short-subunit dehydrogenase
MSFTNFLKELYDFCDITSTKTLQKYILIALLIIIIVFCIQLSLLMISLAKGIHKYFLLKELDLTKRYGSGSWCVITGASSGQGYDFAMEFAARGFNILMIGSKRTDETEKAIKIKYPNIETKIIYKDFTKAFESNFFDDIGQTFTELGNKLGILVNNVGYRTAWEPYHEMPSELIKGTIATGTLVQARLTQLVIPFFIERRNQSPQLHSALINITAQCLHPNFLFGINSTNEISVPYLSVYEAANAFGFYHGNSIYKEYKDKFDILNITPGAVITKNTKYLNDTMFSVNSDVFVKQIIKMMGQVNGHTCAYWGHAFSNFLINLAPFMKDRILEKVGKTISNNFMKDYKNENNKYIIT